MECAYIEDALPSLLIRHAQRDLTVEPAIPDQAKPLSSTLASICCSILHAHAESLHEYEHATMGVVAASYLPARRSAESSESGRLVAPMTKTGCPFVFSRLSESMHVSSCATMRRSMPDTTTTQTHGPQVSQSALCL